MTILRRHSGSRRKTVERLDDVADVVAGEAVVGRQRERRGPSPRSAFGKPAGRARGARCRRSRAGAGCCRSTPCASGCRARARNSCTAVRSMPVARAGTGSASTWCRRRAWCAARTTLSSWRASTSSSGAKFCCRRALNSASLLQLHEPVRGHDLRRLEVVAHVVEHEDRGRTGVPSASGPKRSSSPLRLPNRYVSDRRPHRRRIKRLVEPLGVVDRDHARRCPPR